MSESNNFSPDKLNDALTGLGLGDIDGLRPYMKDEVDRTVDKYVDADGHTKVDTDGASDATRKLADHEADIRYRFTGELKEDQIKSSVHHKHANIIGNAEHDARAFTMYDELVTTSITDEQAMAYLIRERRRYAAIKESLKARGESSEG